MMIEELKSNLRYDPETGHFWWIRKPRNGINMSTPAGANQRGYVCIRINRKGYFAHRLAWFYMTGEWPPKGYQIDHANQDKSDNRWCNLRLATPAQNTVNRGVQANNRSGYKGVFWHKGQKEWRSAIRVNGRSIYLGKFPDPKSAHQAYAKASRNFHGNFCGVE